MCPNRYSLLVVAALLVLVVAVPSVVQSDSFGLCRPFPGSKSSMVKPWSCSTPGDILSCTFSLREIAVVVPITPKDWEQIDMTLRVWGMSGASPCRTGNTDLSSAYVDLYFVNVNNKPGSPEDASKMRSHLMSSLGNSRRCFRNVHVLEGEELVQPVGGAVTPRSVFFSIFGNKDTFVDKYSHFFWMHPALRPVRPQWAHAILMDVVQEYKEMWHKAPVAYYDFDDDIRLNWNSLFRLGDKDFNCVLEKAWESESPSSANINAYQTLALPENRWNLHKSMRSELVVFASWRLYSTFLTDHPNTYFMFGTNAWSDLHPEGRYFGTFESK